MEKKENEVVNENFLNDIKFPFTLKFSKDGISQIYSTLTELNPSNLIYNNQRTDFVYKSYNTTLERKICSIIGINNNFELSDELIGSCLTSQNLLDLSIDIRKKKKKNIVNYLYSIILQKGYINLNLNDIKIPSQIENEIKYIIDSSKEYKLKLIDLYEYFKKIGYFVPLQIYYGGKFNIFFELKDKEDEKKIIEILQKEINQRMGKTPTQKEESEEIEAAPTIILEEGKDILIKKGKKSYYDFISENLKINTIGGESENIIFLSQLGVWYDSLKKENYQIIGYDAIMTIDNFFSEEIRVIYKDYKDDIDNIFKEIRKKFNMLISISKAKELEKKFIREGDGSKKNEWRDGFVNSNDLYIYIKKYRIKTESQLFARGESQIEDKLEPNQIIVGWKITSNWTDGTNGSWEIIGDDPILNNNFCFKFTSQLFRGQSWNLDIFYIDLK